MNGKGIAQTATMNIRIQIHAALTIFTGSFLVFGVQPMVGNTLLPVFGGTAAIWTVCLAAFQLMLVGGYWWGHWMGRGLDERVKGFKIKRSILLIHLVMLLLAAGWVAFAAVNREAVVGWLGEGHAPALCALVAVLILAGAPYVLLSANANIVQMLAGGEYRLYSVSNAGSLCGLLAYPLVVEPTMSVTGQWLAFAVGIAVYAGMLGWGVLRLRSCDAEKVRNEGRKSDVAAATKETSIAAVATLSAVSCFMLNGISAHLTNDVTPIPLMWAVLLALYLASYIVAFTNRGARWARWLFVPVAALCAVGAFYAGIETGKSFIEQLAIGCGLMLLGGWMVHGRLYRMRPGAERLTGYYLAIALGGAAGGMAASLAMPVLFPFVAEYPAALGLLAYVALGEGAERLREGGIVKSSGGVNATWIIVASSAVIALYAGMRTISAEGTVLERRRNFYGTSRVVHDVFKVSDGSGFQVNIFQNNSTIHGYQLAEGGWKSRIPTSYHTDHTGGRAILAHPRHAAKKPMRVALAGMGIGVLASYCREGDLYRFYEINPQVVELATDTNLFTFVSGAAGKVEIVVDDARRALERERKAGEEKYDVLIVDVFSGDSIPAHMATREAVALYLDRLKPDGILAFHISNWHINLSPFAKAVAKEFGLYLEDLQCINDRYTFLSHWTFLSRERVAFAIPGKHGMIKPEDVKDVPLMTDERHSLLPYLGQQKEVDLIPAPKDERRSLF